MAERLQQVDSLPLQKARVSLDSTSEQIFNLKPKEILNKLFSPYDPERVFLLEGTGFSMEGQLRTWINGYKDAIENETSLPEAHRKFVEKTMSDVFGFYYEYLSGQDIFPIELEFRKNEEGQKIIYAPKYHTTLERISEELRERTQEDEREGAMERGVKKAVEILINSGPETIVFINSPKGWSNLTNNGQGIIFPDNQTYVYFINQDGDLDAITLRTDIALTVAERVSGTLNIDPNLNQRERIKAVVEKPIEFKGNSMEQVVDLIEKHAGKKYLKLRNEIVNRDTLFALNEDAAGIMKNLRSFLAQEIVPLNFLNIRSFVIGLGKAVLDLSKKALKDKFTKEEMDLRIFIRNQRRIDPYLGEYYLVSEKVKQIAGCNGGGILSSLRSDELNPEQMQGLDKEKWSYHFGSCVNCSASGVLVGPCNICQRCEKIL